MNKVEITLTRPIKGHDGQVKTLSVTEPSGWQYAELGEPSIVARNPDGTVYMVENDNAIRSYLEKCVTGADPLLWQAQVCLADAMQLKAALLGFFTDARQAKSPTTSTS